MSQFPTRANNYNAAVRLRNLEKELERVRKENAELRRDKENLLRACKLWSQTCHLQYKREEEMENSLGTQVSLLVEQAEISQDRAEENYGKLAFAMQFIPEGENDKGFTFPDGDEMPCGGLCNYSVQMVEFWREALPAAAEALYTILGVTGNEVAREALLKMARLMVLHKVENDFSLGEHFRAVRPYPGQNDDSA